MSTLLSQISWSNHLAIFSKAKTEEERHFYITLCVKENYSARELSRQIDSGYYERYMLSKEKLLPEPIKGLKENPFLDSYVIEFLNLPSNFKEADLRKGLIQNMKDFILEAFTYDPSEFSMRVHSLEEIVNNMCHAELVHELIVALSFTSLLFAIPFGSFFVFLITATMAAIFDMSFVILQRYNRPRVIRLMERKRNDT